MEDKITADQNPGSNVPGSENENTADQNSNVNIPRSENKNTADQNPNTNIPRSKNKNTADQNPLLYQQLNLLNNDEQKDWLCGPNFKPYWNELWDSQLSKQKKVYYRPRLEQVLSVMYTQSKEFNKHYVEKTDQNEVHHYTNFIHQILYKNLQYTDSLFKHRPIGKNEAEALLQTTIKFI